MKNREKFAKEILDIACKGDIIAVTKDNKVVCCDDINCSKCLFYKTDDYGSYCEEEELMEWSESEYVEPKPTITSREKEFLDLLLPDCKYIARNEDESLYVYKNEPIRCRKYWTPNNFCSYCISRDMYGSMFDFIKWEDEEPWSIEDLKKLEVEKLKEVNDNGEINT